MIKVKDAVALVGLVGFAVGLVGCGSHDEADNVKPSLEPANSKFKMSNPGAAGGAPGAPAKGGAGEI